MKLHLPLILRLANAAITVACGAAAIAVGIAIFTLDLRPWGIGDIPVGLTFGGPQWLRLAVGLAGLVALEAAVLQTTCALRARRSTS
jgi:hypothetical protein